MQLNRWDIVQKLIDKNGYKRYLEIGVNKKRTFNRIKCETKVGVDPYVNTDYKMTSDKFFEEYKGRKFDIIFVDGNHFGDYAFRDAINSMVILNENGVIVMHDCKPQCELSQVRPNCPDRAKKGIVAWNGTVWRAWLLLKGTLRRDMYVVDTDNGVGVIKYRSVKSVPNFTMISEMSSCIMEYTEFAKRQKELLNLISVEQFLKEVE